MTSFRWAINSIDCLPQVGPHSTVVHIVYWTYFGSDGAREVSRAGSAELGEPQSPFTPFADLTEAQVVAWVVDAVGPDEIARLQSSMAEQIAALAATVVVTPTLPWAPPEPEPEIAPAG